MTVMRELPSATRATRRVVARCVRSRASHRCVTASSGITTAGKSVRVEVRNRDIQDIVEHQGGGGEQPGLLA